MLELGRGILHSDLTFDGRVTGGGIAGPGHIYVSTGYHKSEYVRWQADYRSGSKRSGLCEWQLEKDRLYQLNNIAYSSTKSATYYLSTYGDEPTELTAADFEAEQQRIWPLQYQDHLDEQERKRIAEIARIERETMAAAERQKEREAKAAFNAEKAKEIETNGQPSDGLPALKGTPKQIAYARTIRDAYAAKNPRASELKKATTAKYWIENHRSVLYR